MSKPRLGNKYLKCPSRENFLAYKKVKNKCITLTRKTKTKNFEYIDKIRTFQQARHSGTQSDLLLQTKAEY